MDRNKLLSLFHDGDQVAQVTVKNIVGLKKDLSIAEALDAAAVEILQPVAEKFAEGSISRENLAEARDQSAASLGFSIVSKTVGKADVATFGSAKQILQGSIPKVMTRIDISARCAWKVMLASRMSQIISQTCKSGIFERK